MNPGRGRGSSSRPTTSASRAASALRAQRPLAAGLRDAPAYRRAGAGAGADPRQHRLARLGRPPMWDELVGEAKSGYFAAMAGRVPAGKVAAPADVAPAYLYLMEAEFMTGETIHIDGGQRLA